jgi:glutathione S-transferase
MKLYYAPNTCSLAPHIVLRELGLPFSLVRVNNQTKLTADGRDYRDINPKGYVAALALEDGTIISEGPAILLYLVSLVPDSPLATAPGSLPYIRLLEWLNFLATELHAGMSPLFNRTLPQEVKDTFETRLFRRFDYLETALQENLFLLGDVMSVADIYLYVLCGWCNVFSIDLDGWPALHSHYRAIHARHTTQAAWLAE